MKLCLIMLKIKIKTTVFVRKKMFFFYILVDCPIKCWFKLIVVLLFVYGCCYLCVGVVICVWVLLLHFL